jgi:hypothetical protein
VPDTSGPEVSGTSAIRATTLAAAAAPIADGGSARRRSLETFPARMRPEIGHCAQGDIRPAR